jgi:hypothetical protein
MGDSLINTESIISLGQIIELFREDDELDNEIDEEQWAGNLQLEESINRARITTCHDDEENLLEDDDCHELIFD